MNMTDPLADLLTRMRNAIRVKRRTLDVPLSKEKMNVLAVLKREGFIEDFKSAETGTPQACIRIWLKYSRVGESVVRDLQRVSTPGRRLYRRMADIKPVLRGTGISVISTSKGVLSDRECRKENVGGEVLCKVW